MAERNIVPERDFTEGEVFESPPINAARLERYSVIRVYRLDWPDTGADVIRISQLYSPDNGQTWQGFGGLTAVGGVYILRGGAVLEFHSLVTSAFPGEDNPQRRIKVKIETFTGLRTRVTAETSETPISQQGGPNN